MVDDPELGLDPSSAWVDEEFDKDVMDVPRPPAKAVKRKKRSMVSVSSFLSYCCYIGFLSIYRAVHMWCGNSIIARTI